MIQAQDVFDLENDEELSSFLEPITGTPVWLLVRNYFLRAVIESFVFHGGATPRFEPTYRIGELLMSAAVSVASGPLPVRHPVPILLMGSGAGVIERNGRRVSRLTGYFAELLGDRAWTEEGVHLFDWRQAVQAPRTTLTAHHRLVDRARARISQSSDNRKLAALVVASAARSAQSRLGWKMDDSQVAGIAGRLAIELASVHAARARVRMMQRRYRPRLVLSDMCCYSTKILFNMLCREQGIEVAEFQHGVITRAHDAYNIGTAWLRRPEMKRALPSALLTYGPWWGSQISVPIEKVVVGNPHLEESFGARHVRSADADDILVLGDGVDTDFYFAMCADLSKQLADRRIVFRPHPIERSKARTLHRRVNYRFTLDLEPNMYTSFQSAGWVVTELSTGLFEAVGTGPRVVMLNTEKSRFYLPESPFAIASTSDEVAAMIVAGESARTATDPAELWAPGWRDRFLAFVAPFLQ